MITLTQEDWVKLSLPTRQELKNVLKAQFQALTEESMGAVEGQNRAMYDLDDRTAIKFMAGVSKKTAAFFKCFIKNGKGNIDELIEATGYENSGDFRGLLGGVTRRIRKLTNDPDACLVGKVEDDDDERGKGHYFITEKSRQALENYFSE